MAQHPKLDKGNCFASTSTNTIKKFNLPIEGRVYAQHMLSEHKTIINALAANADRVMSTRGDNEGLWFWDWNSVLIFNNPKQWGRE